MKINVKKAMQLLEKYFKKEWSKITFNYKLESEKFQITADVTLKGFDQDLLLVIDGYEGGGASFRVVFDKFNDTADLYEKMNKFNDENLFFKAFLRNDGYFELKHFIVMYDVNTYSDYGNEFLHRVLKLNEFDTLIEITE